MIEQYIEHKLRDRDYVRPLRAHPQRTEDQARRETLPDKKPPAPSATKPSNDEQLEKKDPKDMTEEELKRYLGTSNFKL